MHGERHGKFNAAWLCDPVFWQTLQCDLNIQLRPVSDPEDPLTMTEQARTADHPPAARDSAVHPQTNSAQPTGQQAEQTPTRPREIGGREGLEPTRYGDWEMRGRCIDF